MRLNKIKNAMLCISCLVYLGCNQVAADLLDHGALDQINNSIAFGLSGLNLDYKESFLESDRKPNGVMPKSTESGNIIGFYLNPRITFLNDNLYTDLYLDYYDGTLKYDGQELYSPYAPKVAKLGQRFFNTNLKIGYVFSINFNESFAAQAIPYVGAGFRYWDRLYNTLSREKYYHGKYVGGLKLNFLLGDSFIISPHVEVGRIFDAKMRLCSSGILYNLGKNPIYEGGIELNYKLFDEFFLNSFVSYSSFKYNRSDVRGGLFEPDSKTRELKFGLGIRYSWLIN